MKRLLFDRLGRRQRGQTLILFTLMFTVLVGFLALAIDLGFLFGQRRWNQDGSDSAAIALGHVIAKSVSPLSDGTYYIIDSDCNLYATARQYGGLDTNVGSCNSALSSTPTGVNQNAGLSSSNKVAVVLEYSNGSSSDDTWCFSPASINTLPNGTLAANTYPRTGESVCSLYQNTYPPQPGSHPYKVRVTVSSVTTSTFAQMFVPNGNLGPSSQPSNQTADQATPACVRPGGANGMLACSQAVVTISGDVNPFPGLGNVIPVSVNDCNVGGPVGQIYQLWSSNGNTKSCNNTNVNPWKSFVDFTNETVWCNYYKYQDVLPDLVNGQTRTSYGVGNCQNEPDPLGSEHNWDRKNFVPDANYTGASNPTDLNYWTSQGFGGTIWAAKSTATDPGNFVPTYCDRVGNFSNANGASCGDLGNNVAVGFYCMKNDVPANHSDDCPDNPSGSNGHTATYFFRWDSLDTDCPIPGGGQAGGNIRCRTAAVPTWDDPEWAIPNNWNTNSGGAPDRVRLIRILAMRLYCGLETNGSGYENCTGVPQGVPGVGNSNSGVYGLFVSDDPKICPPGDTCNGGLSITINVPALTE